MVRGSQWLVLGVALAGVGAQAAADGGVEVRDISEISLEELLDTPVSVASATGASTSSRETPAVVTVLTREEIHDLGARDLIDVLRFVPGLDFNNDVEGTVGLSVRGNWALEGKALVLLDGMAINDLAYGNALFGSREAIELIERIEIIRGPGSTLYGGFGELAVINVVTHPDVPVNRLEGALTWGQLPTTLGRAAGSLLASHSFGEVNVRASIFTSTGVRSDGTYNVGGTPVSMAQYSRISPLNFSVGAQWRGLAAQLIFDDYYFEAPVADDLSQPLRKHHKNLHASLLYELPINDKFTVKAQASYLHQNSWESTDAFSLQYGYYENKPTDRFIGGLQVQAKPIEQLRIMLGGTFTHDTSTAPPSSDPAVQMINTYLDQNGNSTPTLSFNDVAAFAEIVGLTPWVNITAGARFDYHSVYGTSFVPRVALTKELGRFHAKALFSRAFRAPTFENISLFPKIKPETTNVFELEAGYQFTPWLYAAANVFDNRLFDTIVYQESGMASSYVNAGQTGTQGVEAEVKARGGWGYATLGYSFYRATAAGVTQYNVDGHPDLHLGTPAHKLTARASFKVLEHVAINPSLILLSERYGLETAPDATDAVVTRFDPVALFDVFVVVRDVGYEGLEISGGVHDLFGANYKFVPAYNASVNAMPGPGREVMVRIAYLHDFAK